MWCTGVLIRLLCADSNNTKREKKKFISKKKNFILTYRYSEKLDLL